MDYRMVQVANLPPMLADELARRRFKKKMVEVTVGDAVAEFRPRAPYTADYDYFDPRYYAFAVSLKTGESWLEPSYRSEAVVFPEAVKPVAIVTMKSDGRASVRVDAEGAALLGKTTPVKLIGYAATLLRILTQVRAGKYRGEYLQRFKLAYGEGPYRVALDQLLENGLVKMSASGALIPTPLGREKGHRIRGREHDPHWLPYASGKVAVPPDVVLDGLSDYTSDVLTDTLLREAGLPTSSAKARAYVQKLLRIGYDEDTVRAYLTLRKGAGTLSGIARVPGRR